MVSGDKKPDRAPASLDELSIDSKTDKKIHISRGLEHDEQQQQRRQTGTTKVMAPKQHFRIDWRQLTYYQKQERSPLDGLWRRSSRGEHSDVIYELHEELEQQELEQQELEQQELEQQELEQETNCGFSRRSPFIGSSWQTEGSAQRPTSRRRRPILNALDGCFKSGELNAILGPSGAGKSTFLSALFGNKQESSYGQTQVTWSPDAHSSASTGEPPTANTKQLTKRPLRIAVLPQHDHLLHHLSVQETLMFASKIKNPREASASSFHRQNVRRVAKMLKLTDCLQTRCGRLSGGQYKRVSIGQELLSEPDVIILDEPTSGLDAMTCLTTVRTLKAIAQKHSISIILTIHQPDSDVFNLFDQVYVIAQGGMAIYQGPPGGVAAALAQVNLFMPSKNYNPARFIVENAFVADLDSAAAAATAQTSASCAVSTTTTSTGALLGQGGRDSSCLTSDEHEHEHEHEHKSKSEHQRQKQSLISKSISSLTDALAAGGSLVARQVELRPASLLSYGNKTGGCSRLRDSGRRPLLNIGIQTADGKLITSEQLVMSADQQQQVVVAERLLRKQQIERLKLLRRLNAMQREQYYGALSSAAAATWIPESGDAAGCLSAASSDLLSQQTLATSKGSRSTPAESEDSLSASSSGWSEARETMEEEGEEGEEGEDSSSGLSFSESTASCDEHQRASAHFIVNFGQHPATLARDDGASAASTLRLNRARPDGGRGVAHEPLQLLGCNMSNQNPMTTTPSTNKKQRLRRQFDKRLSARHTQSKQRDLPIWYHSFLLTHRTWLSIVRDPVFFGIQFVMHTTIPILLALIFGSQQNEGCPQVGNFDLIQFAYSNQADFIQSTMRSIRQSVGNIGIIFFEMFVLSFAINCITALVFPLDMYVLLKEYRNGWYSLRSYFFGRTLADLPVPVVLHSLAMGILYYMTGQPLVWWRFLAIIGIVILSSLVAQSVGLTVGALLMRSSQSAVLAAAGIVAPFFALSGFIVRIQTLPWVAQWAAQGSYLYHLLNGFIILRYGFDRCHCSEDDFRPDEAHQVPSNIRTLASMWVGTYSNEFDIQTQPSAHTGTNNNPANRTNLDPNIDLIDKLMSAFKMANSFGHKVETCDDVLPYAMLDFNLKDVDIWHCCLSLAIMLVVSRAITFGAIYYKIRSFS